MITVIITHQYNNYSVCMYYICIYLCIHYMQLCIVLYQHICKLFFFQLAFAISSSVYLGMYNYYYLYLFIYYVSKNYWVKSWNLTSHYITYYCRLLIRAQNLPILLRALWIQSFKNGNVELWKLHIENMKKIFQIIFDFLRTKYFNVLI